MTHRQQKFAVLSTLIFAFVMIGVFINVYSCQAEEPPKPGDFLPVDNSPDAMIYHSPIPLTTARFIAYGRVVPDRAGNKVPNLADETKVIQKARDIRDKLLLVRDPKGFFALQVVMVQHSSIIVVKEPSLPWDLILPEIETILSTLEN